MKLNFGRWWNQLPPLPLADQGQTKDTQTKIRMIFTLLPHAEQPYWKSEVHWGNFSSFVIWCHHYSLTQHSIFSGTNCGQLLGCLTWGFFFFFPSLSLSRPLNSQTHFSPQERFLVILYFRVYITDRLNFQVTISEILTWENSLVSFFHSTNEYSGNTMGTQQTNIPASVELVLLG